MSYSIENKEQQHTLYNNEYGFIEKTQERVQKLFAEEQKVEEDYEFKYYTKEKMLKNGTFDLRFESIINSPINSGAFNQLGFAVPFQLKKMFKHNWFTKYNALETIPEKEFKSNPNEIRAYWLGHASVLLSIDSDTRIIIDPMFDKRIVPVVGEARHLEPPCPVEKLPKIDCVLISHDHYDHCNTNSLQSILVNKQNKDIIFLVGKNSSDILPKECIQSKAYKELSWTESHILKRNNKVIRITFVPACHWSKRTLYDQNKRLWGGFVIETLGKKIYFAGDTGKCELFPELERKFGGFDLSLLPIGAYEPNEKLKFQHINPKEAVEIHNQIKSKLSVGIHWGTFPMSHEQPHEVLEDLEKARKDIIEGEFKTIKIGQSVAINGEEKKLLIENKMTNFQ